MLDFILTGNSEGRTLTVAFPDFSTRIFNEETPGFDSIIDVILEQTNDDFETADLIMSIITDDKIGSSDDCDCPDCSNRVDNGDSSLESLIYDLAKQFDNKINEEVDSSGDNSKDDDPDPQPSVFDEPVDSESKDDDDSAGDDSTDNVDPGDHSVDVLEEMLALLGVRLTSEGNSSKTVDQDDSSISDTDTQVYSDVMSKHHHEPEEDTSSETDPHNLTGNISEDGSNQQDISSESNSNPFASTINSVVLGRVIPVRIPVSQANFTGYAGPGPFMRI